MAATVGGKLYMTSAREYVAGPVHLSRNYIHGTEHLPAGVTGCARGRACLPERGERDSTSKQIHGLLGIHRAPLQSQNGARTCSSSSSAAGEGRRTLSR